MPVRKATADLPLPCGASGGSTTVAADWWFPQGVAPSGVVWLQHGFSRSKGNVATLAEAIAARTGSVVVAPTISSRFLSLAGCWINGIAMHRAVARMFGDRRAALQASADAAATAAGSARTALPSAFVLAGHSAGGNLAASAAGFTTQVTVDGRPGGPLVVRDLRGVVMLDGVDHRGAIGAALERLTGADARPVRTVAAPDSSCNARGSGTRVLEAARPGRFVGVRLAGGSHLDAEGPDTTRLAIRVCGAPGAANVDAVRFLAAGWIADLLGGTDTPALLAGTAPGTVSVLPSGASATTL